MLHPSMLHPSMPRVPMLRHPCCARLSRTRIAPALHLLLHKNRALAHIAQVQTLRALAHCAHIGTGISLRAISHHHACIFFLFHGGLRTRVRSLAQCTAGAALPLHHAGYLSHSYNLGLVLGCDTALFLCVQRSIAMRRAALYRVVGGVVVVIYSIDQWPCRREVIFLVIYALSRGPKWVAGALCLADEHT